MEPITVFSVFMMSCAVESSFSFTVTSINDPLCTVFAANLQNEGEKKVIQQADQSFLKYSNYSLVTKELFAIVLPKYQTKKYISVSSYEA